ncbi:hypothetical protein CRG98_016175 [Punica granatum]|uniref:Retrotransposon Copia-like N-terminal domain-containing protein n=1 Tax=Punica granatum TaxID=22663 RepID=A0A2I0K4N7_PUNGR|nr:hypothetical protein CRG98_016175 [Punica granatum]
MAANNSSPYTVSSSDGPGNQLISCTLNGENYLTWSKLMWTALIAKNKIAFVNGTIQKPNEGDANYQQWVTCNSMVVAWLSNSVDQELRPSVACIQNAKTLRDDLKERFSQGKGKQLGFHQMKNGVNGNPGPFNTAGNQAQAHVVQTSGLSAQRTGKPNSLSELSPAQFAQFQKFLNMIGNDDETVDPRYLKDFVCNTVVIRPPHSTTPTPSSSSIAIDSDVEPKSYKEAFKDPRWRAAMNEEVRALELNKT